LSTEGWPGPMLPSPTPARTLDDMTPAEARDWFNDAYKSQVYADAIDLINIPDAEFARVLGVASGMVARAKAAVAGVGAPRAA
jgi:hypothetical protein